MVYHSLYNPTEQTSESTLIDGKRTYLFKDKDGNITRTETFVDEEIFDTTIHVQLYPIALHNYYIEYNLLDLKKMKIKSKLYKRGSNILWQIDYDKNSMPQNLIIYNNKNEPIKTLKHRQNIIWEEKRVIRTGFFSKKTEIVQYRENPQKGGLTYYHINRLKEELFFDENGILSKIQQKDMIGNVIKVMDAHSYNLNFDPETGVYTAIKKSQEELNMSLDSHIIKKPIIQKKENTTESFDEQNRIIERLYYDEKKRSYKKETYTYDETGYTKTSWHLKGTFWHKHGHEVRYSLQNEIISADYYNDHKLVLDTQADNELKIYAENYANNSYIKTLKTKLNKINSLTLFDLSKDEIDQIHDMVRLNPDRFELKRIKIINSFPQKNEQITIPFTNLESLDLSEANLNHLDKIVIPNTSTELKTRLNKVKGPEIDFSECKKIEKLTLDLSNSPTVERFIFPPNMKELNLSIDNVTQLECIDLSAYKDLKINFSYKGDPKNKAKPSYALDLSYQNESDRFEAIKKLAIFAEIQNKKKKTTKLQIKLHKEHALMQKENIISPVEEKQTEQQKCVASKKQRKKVSVEKNSTKLPLKTSRKIQKKTSPSVSISKNKKENISAPQTASVVQEEVKIVTRKRIVKARMNSNLNNREKNRE